MKNITEQYKELKEGKVTNQQFLRNARMMFPSYITNQNSLADSVNILKQKGLLNEGDAVKGVPDKAPVYEIPTYKTKYKRVEQEPEDSEQNGIYPATTLTDIPKPEKIVKVKNESDGLEPIKEKDEKNAMKKIRLVKTTKKDKNKKKTTLKESLAMSPKVEKLSDQISNWYSKHPNPKMQEREDAVDSNLEHLIANTLSYGKEEALWTIGDFEKTVKSKYSLVFDDPHYEKYKKTTLKEVFNGYGEGLGNQEAIGPNKDYITAKQLVAIAKRAGQIMKDAETKLMDMAGGCGDEVPKKRVRDVLDNFEISIEDLKEGKKREQDYLDELMTTLSRLMHEKSEDKDLNETPERTLADVPRFELGETVTSEKKGIKFKITKINQDNSIEAKMISWNSGNTKDDKGLNEASSGSKDTITVKEIETMLGSDKYIADVLVEFEYHYEEANQIDGQNESPAGNQVDAVRIEELQNLEKYNEADDRWEPVNDPDVIEQLKEQILKEQGEYFLEKIGEIEDNGPDEYEY